MKKRLVGIGLLVLMLFAISGAAFAANVSFEEKRAIIESKVRGGLISQEAADGFLSELTARMAECDCDGSCEGPDENRERLGQKYDIRFGFGKSNQGMNGQNGSNGLGQRNGK